MQRTTKQLGAVLEVLRASGEHLTADEVWARVRERMPQVSRATVYRNLEKLVSQGVVAEVQLAKRATRYDPTLTPHDHFVCERCGLVQDILDRSLDASKPPSLPPGTKVHGVKVTWYGTCARCRRPGEARASGAARSAARKALAARKSEVRGAQ